MNDSPEIDTYWPEPKMYRFEKPSNAHPTQKEIYERRVIPKIAPRENIRWQQEDAETKSYHKEKKWKCFCHTLLFLWHFLFLDIPRMNFHDESNNRVHEQRRWPKAVYQNINKDSSKKPEKH